MGDPLRRALERMTARYLGAVGLSAVSACAVVQSCGGASRDSASNAQGTMITMVPNGAAGGSGEGATGGAGAAGGVVGATGGTTATSAGSAGGYNGPRRALPTSEPCSMCGITCAVPGAPAPPPLYPPPYEACAPDDGRGGLFAVQTTEAHRQSQPGVCCYLNPSVVPPLGRPFPERTGRAVVAAVATRGDWAA